MLRNICIGFALIAMCVSLFCLAVDADSIKLRNGGFFEGKILEDTGSTLKMEMELGVVEFKKTEIAEVVHADVEGNVELMNEWTPSDNEDEDVLKSSESKLLDAYLNKGKVKYQGRWITQDAYDVIQKEREIKEKRYRFMQDRKKRESAQEAADTDLRIGKNARVETSSAETENPFASRTKTFGGTKTNTFGSAAITMTDEQRNATGFGKTKTYGTSKTFAEMEKGF